MVAMWLYWFGGIYGSYEGSHIKGDMLSSVFKSPRSKKIVELVIQAVSFVVILVFCIWGFEYMAFNLRFNAVTTGLKIPMSLSQMPLLVGFLLMELYTVFNFFRVLLDKDFGKAKEPAEEGEASNGIGCCICNPAGLYCRGRTGRVFVRCGDDLARADARLRRLLRVHHSLQ